MAFAEGSFDKNSWKASVERGNFIPDTAACHACPFDPLNRPSVDRGKMKLFPSSPPMWNTSENNSGWRTPERSSGNCWIIIETSIDTNMTLQRKSYSFTWEAASTSAGSSRFFFEFSREKHVRVNVKTRRGAEGRFLQFSTEILGVYWSSKAVRYLRLPFSFPFFFQLAFDSIRARLRALLLREIKRAVFVSPKNRANKFRRLVPVRRRYSSRRRAGFSPANISRMSLVSPGVAHTRPFFFSGRFPALDPFNDSSDTFKPNRWQIIELFRRREKYVRATRTRRVFSFFSPWCFVPQNFCL